ncbi:hypothetical protein EV196_106274 [Mariniflexile fucanivorans]|uniref:Dihydroorotase n=1 Tax=Mariniflexile fucanivorans TaxID=264023 RepID=A0A4R1RGI0_9FLAO|nr:hypothetical protein [Mariniflexile fucanivorans]TCL65081.1 hypothetical protein EV196_106274 [Mariniflexile fucanivorans]
MKKIFYLLLLAGSFSFANNTNPTDFKQNDPKIGDVLVINSTSNVKYNHIDFPQLNIVAKRGNVANYKSVHGKRVVVKEVLNNDNGNTKILIENEDKSKFFGFLRHVEATYEKSITSGEMSKVNP